MIKSKLNNMKHNVQCKINGKNHVIEVQRIMWSVSLMSISKCQIIIIII